MDSIDSALDYFKNKDSNVSDTSSGSTDPIDEALDYFKNKKTAPSTSEAQPTVLPNPEPITQRFGNYNPSVEVFSKGRALGTNIAADVGTPVAVPPGNWQVESTYTTANSGYIGNGVNKGYGNDVKVRNANTGEILHFTHLSNVNVMPGQIVSGSTVIGKTGATGNVTGPHLNLEYYTPQGQLADVMQSPYSQYIPTQ